MKKLILISLMVLLFISCSTKKGWSNDIADWNAITRNANFSPRELSAVFVYAGQGWVIAGNNGDVFADTWHSPNGYSWSQGTDFPDYFGGEFMGTSLNGYAYVVRRTSDEVYRMTNGNDWEAVTKNAEVNMGQMFTSFNNKLYTINNSGEVWNSTDGAEWINNTKNAEWKPYIGNGSQLVTWNNKMWLTGGGLFGSTDSSKDVWSSENGTEWVAVTRNAQFTALEDHESFIWNDKIWVVNGRTAGGGAISDVWSSTDGIEWTQDTSFYAPRFDGRSFVINNNAIILIGFNADPTYYNDVWIAIQSTTTPTSTPTNTPVLTITSSYTKTNTPSPTSTNTPSPTSTSTPTHTKTSTITMTNSPTPTNTPTMTISATISATATITPSRTNTPVVTATVTPTATPLTNPIIWYGSTSYDGHRIKMYVHWTKYYGTNQTYTLGVGSEDITLTNADDESVYDGYFSYEVDKINFETVLAYRLTATADNWASTLPSNVISFSPKASPTP